jgi:hypothetical protein
MWPFFLGSHGNFEITIEGGGVCVDTYDLAWLNLSKASL